MTIGVYGLVACIVKFDDWGLALQQRTGDSAKARMQRAIGDGLVNHTPKFMKALSIIGTVAMFAVGGGILVHGIPGIETAMKSAITAITANGFLAGTLNMIGTIVAGMVAGLISMPFFNVLGKGIGKIKPHAAKAFSAFKKPA